MDTIDRLQEILDPKQRVYEEVNRALSRETEHLKNVDRIVCADGFSMSVQASAFHYCSPRDNEGPYTAVEIGYPSEKVDDFMEYIDGGEDDDPTSTVYGYVPLKIVAKTVDTHGGFSKT
jgi:hypothetical protein